MDFLLVLISTGFISLRKMFLTKLRFEIKQDSFRFAKCS